MQNWRWHAVPAGIARCLQRVLNAALLLLGLILVVFPGKETWHLARVLLQPVTDNSKYSQGGGLMVYAGAILVMVITL